MTYLLGSEVEAIHFTDDAVEYRPAGRTHAVDTDSTTSTGDSVLAYAVCGTPVRVWPAQRFDAAAPEAHEQCAGITRATAGDDSTPEPERGPDRQ